MRPSQIFISYANKTDGEKVWKLKRVLDNHFGLDETVFIAPDGVGWGNKPFQDIKNAIRNCDVFVMILTDAYHTASFTEQEAGMALGFGKKIVPIMFDKDAVPHGWVRELSQGKLIDENMKDNHLLRELYGALLDVDLDRLALTDIIDEFSKAKKRDVDIFWAEKMLKFDHFTDTELKRLQEICKGKGGDGADHAMNMINDIFFKHKYPLLCSRHKVEMVEKSFNENGKNVHGLTCPYFDHSIPDLEKYAKNIDS